MFDTDEWRCRREALAQALEARGITYVYPGDSLGGHPADPTFYTPEGKIDYNRVQTKDFYQAGIARLKTAYAKDIALAIMCAEGKPSECHRTRLIARTLVAEHIAVAHIDEHGGLQEHRIVMEEIRGGLPETDLFGN